jgi:TIR domain
MRIFLTFASEQRDIAESILLALRNRGHDVFFSHDDLPSGDSFDTRIEKAIGKSDLLVFLVSPESIAKGRYTLTELAFARDRWRSPKGRVLPVLVAPTPMGSLPNYLRAVTLLEPEGNIAAETGAAVDRMLDRSRSRSILILALLGIASGVLSYLSIRFAPEFLKFSFLIQSYEKSGAEPTTVVPGVIFGALVALCVYHYGVRDKFLLSVAVLFTTIAWILAYDSTSLVYAQLAQFKKATEAVTSIPPASDDATSEPAAGTEQNESSDAPTPKPGSEYIPYLASISGLVGGLVGGLLTIFGVTIANPAFRRVDSWVTTLFVATALGMLLEVVRFGEDIGFLTLFAVWQPAVIASIARGMAFADPNSG